MSYTLHKEKWIEDKIQQDMDIIREEILNVVKPISILLIGSFGRGEGSVLVENGNVFPLKDYDILLVLDKKEPLPLSKLQKIEEEIYNRSGYGDPTNRDFLFSDFVITIERTTLDNLKNFAHLGVSEIKIGSKVLYGKDIREEIPLKVEDIPLSSGLHFLFMKTIGLLGHFSTEYFYTPPVGFKKTYLIYECGKTYVEIGTALSLLGEIYEPTFLERSKIIKRVFKEVFPKLAEELPDLLEKIDYFTHLKLFPDKETYGSIDPVSLWFETRNDLGMVLKYYMKRLYGVEYNDRDVFSTVCYHSMKKEYFKGMIKYYLKMRFNLNNMLMLFTPSANFFYQKYFSLKYVLDLYREKGIFYPRAFLESPILKLFSISPLLLFSLNEDGSLDEHLFATFTKELRKIYPLKTENLNGENKWNMTKNYLLKAFELYKGQR